MEAEHEDKTTAAATSKTEWLKCLQSVDVYESDLLDVVINYFTIHGYQEAAEKLVCEANAKCQMQFDTFNKRMKIKEAILDGRFEEAINLIESWNPQILERKPTAGFSLRQQQLLGLIKQGETLKAIDFAQQYLAPTIKRHAELLPTLERIMSLLAFKDPMNADAWKVLQISDGRAATAKEIDDIILDFYNVDNELILEDIIKELLYTQANLPQEVPILEDYARGGILQPPSKDATPSPIVDSLRYSAEQHPEDLRTQIEESSAESSPINDRGE